ncbi:MAG TPA: hypothetical protein VK468_08085 [Pyrinomonadaceae bacterium]|nr:hypothetical protein [Pyrinomonadaceae bacterium]
MLWILIVAGSFGGASSLGSWETPVIILCGLGCIASFLICPLGAFLIRQSIFDFVDAFPLRLLVFCLIAGFQVLTITTLYFSVQVYGSILENRWANRTLPHRKLRLQLEDANMRVSVKWAKILSDNGENITAEITLRMENVPLVLPYYEIYISRINNRSGEFFIEPYIAYSELPKPWIRATNLHDKWTFEEIETKQFLSNDPDELTFQIEFARRHTSQTALPASITPTLLIRWKDYNESLGDPSINLADFIFFDRAIAIDFE